jgi:hypothetical protein
MMSPAAAWACSRIFPGTKAIQHATQQHKEERLKFRVANIISSMLLTSLLAPR